MKTLRSLMLVALELPAVSCLAGSDEPLVLVRSGVASDCAVVIAADASPSVKQAADELCANVEKSTGVRLPLVTDAEPLPKKAILVGPSRLADRVMGGACDLAPLGEDGFRLVARPPHVVILGSRRRGALYGAYEFLERFVGCRWYASWRTVVPSRREIVVPRDLDDTQIPAFETRSTHWYDPLANQDFAAHLRLNARFGAAPTEERFGGNDRRCGAGLFVHTLGYLLPQAEFYEAHPEYYCLAGGKRDRFAQPCLTNPDVLKIVTERLLDCIRKDPGAAFYSVSQNDLNRTCECPACQAVNAAEESQAGTLIRFVNAVAEAVEREFPKAIIKTLAYQFSRRPPKLTRPRHNVAVELCTLECDFSRPLEKSAFFENVAFLDVLAGWSKITDRLSIWDYTTDFSNYPMPFANVASLQDNIRLFRRHGVKTLFEQGAYQGRHGEFAELKCWLLAKWMWNPDLPAKQLVAEFLDGYYGPAAPFVGKYLSDLHRCQREYSARENKPLGIFDMPSNPALDDAFYERAFRLWSEAAAAVKDDPALAYNVRMSALSLDYSLVFRENYLLKFADAGKKPAGTLPDVRTCAKNVLDRMAEASDLRLGELDAWNNMRLDVLRRAADPSAPAGRLAQGGVGVIEDHDFELVTSASGNRMCEFADDKAASDGRAVRIFGTHYEWCVNFRLYRVQFRPGRRYAVRARLRVDKKGDGEAFWAGVYDPSGESKTMTRATAETSGDYRWYDICEFTPTATAYFWMGPGRYDAKGHSSVREVWLDQIEFRELDDRAK